MVALRKQTSDSLPFTPTIVRGAPPRLNGSMPLPAISPISAFQRDSLFTWMEAGRLQANLMQPKPLNFFETALLTSLSQFRVGYMPPVPPESLDPRMLPWRDRIVFEIGTMYGNGYMGLSLDGWEDDMDHNAFLSPAKKGKNQVQRWIHAGSRGWFMFQNVYRATRLILVEEPLDAILLQSYIEPTLPYAIVALCHSGVFNELLPRHIRELLPAFPSFQGLDFAAMYPSWRVTPYDPPAETWFSYHISTMNETDHIGYGDPVSKFASWLQTTSPPLMPEQFVCQNISEHRSQWMFHLGMERYLCPRCEPNGQDH